MSRVRTSDTTSVLPGNRTITYARGSKTNSAFSGPRVGERVWMMDVLTPGFKKRSNEGEIIISPMHRTVDTLTSTTTGYQHTLASNLWPVVPLDGAVIDHFTSLLHWKLGPLGYRGDPDFTVPDLVPPGVRTSAYTLAATAALGNWKSASVQSMVFLAELRKTVDTLRNPVKALTQEIARGAKKGYSLKGSLKGASGQYLTWFYGIRSLMFDIEGAQEALKVMSSCMRETGRGKVEEVYRSDVVNDLHNGSALINSRYRTEMEHKFTVRAGLVGDTEMNVGSSRGFGYRLSDIPGTLWELTPWSFVADWGLNLGEFIDSLFADTTTGVKGQWLTTIEEVTVKRSVTSCTTTAGWNITGACADKDTAVYLTKTRSPTNLADYRGISLRTGFQRVPELAALALVIQQFTKR